MTAAEYFRNYFTKDYLEKLFINSVQYRNAKGIDNISKENFSKNLSEYINQIIKKAENGTYRFSQFKEVLLSRGSDKNPRVISIPTMRDKLTLKALHEVIYPLFNENIYSLHRTIASLITEYRSRKYECYIRLDVKDFYPSINHEILIRRIKRRIRKQEILHLIKDAISQITVVNPNKKYRDRNKAGIPQGLSISNILANIYLLNIDNKYMNMRNIEYYRFVDDILILCEQRDVEKITILISEDCKKIGLSLHENTKSEHEDTKSQSGLISSDFTYLGYKFTNNPNPAIRL